MHKDSQCYFCASSSFQKVHEEHNYEARQCTTCGTVYPNPFPDQSIIDPTLDLHETQWYQLSSVYKLKWLKQRHPAPCSIFEIGCGEGDFLRMARAEGYTVAGIEPHKERAKKCRETGLDVEEFLLEDYVQKSTRRFDIVYHVDLLAHFRDPLQALAQMKQILNPNGVLYFEVGALGGLHPWWYKQVGHIGLPHHLWLFSQKSLSLLFAQANLKVCDMRSFGLASTVALGKSVRVLRRLGNRNVVPLNQRSHTSKHNLKLKIHMFTRYRMGAFFPKVGPTTHFYLLKPQ